LRTLRKIARDRLYTRRSACRRTSSGTSIGCGSRRECRCRSAWQSGTFCVYPRRDSGHKRPNCHNDRHRTLPHEGGSTLLRNRFYGCGPHGRSGDVATVSWLLSIVVGLASAVTGFVGAWIVAVLCVGWYRVSSFEGEAGYFVALLALL